MRNEATLIGQEIATINLIPVRNIPVTFMQPEPPDSDDASEPSVIPRAIPVKSKTGADSSSSKDKAKPARKNEPAKPKESPKGESGLLKHFRTA